MKIFEIREPREDGAGAEVWRYCGAASDRWWHRPVQPAALSAQAEHHGSHCECTQAGTHSAAWSIRHFTFKVFSVLHKRKQTAPAETVCGTRVNAVQLCLGIDDVCRQDAVCTLLPRAIIDLVVFSCVNTSFLWSWYDLYKARCCLCFYKFFIMKIISYISIIQYE